ncbi:MAG TPA: lipase maturation factor family protein, partial [Terriglobia bacterium]|nr:lipase maturation factor family protein [Terriglobia bacterium]
LLTATLFPLGIARIVEQIALSLPAPLEAALRYTSPFQMVNSYGLFAVMTTSRPEIVIEGSDDDVTWLPYEFRYKPGDLARAPRWAAPHQPRLDWQMWFAALRDFRSEPWIVGLAQRLLEGSPDVLSLLETNPFPDHPPRYIRARLYDYRFTTIAERRETGHWWKRRLLGEYLPTIGLRTAGNVDQR